MIQGIVDDILFRQASFIGVVAVVAIFYSLLARLVVGWYINGLILAQLSFTFNTSVMVFLLLWEGLPVGRFLHYCVLEGCVVVATMVFYRIVLSHRRLILDRCWALPLSKIAWIVSIAIGMFCVLNLIVVPVDGSSRIQHMTSWWFSYVRVPMALLLPFGYFLTALLLVQRKYVVAGILALTLTLQSATSGSKAGFLLAGAGGLLLFRDLSGFRVKIRRTTIGLFGAGLLGATVVVLDHLNVTAHDVYVRLLNEAEATIMVYMADDPTEAGRDVSAIAAVHRGIAKVIGDESARNIDTLFGFKLSAIYYGANTFTGPNSSIPAYYLCNFYGAKIVIGAVPLLGYFLAMWLFYRNVVIGRQQIGVVLLPFVIFSINSFCQDYYTGMSDLTTVGFCAVFFFFFYGVRPQR